MKHTETLPADWSVNEKDIWQKIARQVARWKSQGEKVVLATGVFDIFHSEHQLFLTKAKQAGDRLIVGLESDVRVRAMKGPDRPVYSQAKRQLLLQSFPAVDVVAVLPEKFERPAHHRALIALLRPDTLAVSSHSPYQEQKQAILQEFGGTLEVVHEHNPAISTTQLLDSRG